MVFSLFQILIFQVVREVKGQKTVQNDKEILSVALHISGTIYHMTVIYVHICKMIISSSVFFLSCSISQESYIIWLLFMVQMWKMIISPSVFFNFKILIFQVFRGLKGQKMAQNDKIFCLLHLIFQWPYVIWFSFIVSIYL